MRAFHVLFLFAIAACAKSSDMPPPDDDAGMPIGAPMLTVLGGTCGGNGVTFQWNEIKGATYTLEYWLVNQPPTMVQLPVGTTTYMSPKLSPGMYQANIKANLGTGDTGFSQAKSFTVVQGKAASFTQMSQMDFAANMNMGVFVAMDGVVLSSSADGGNGADGAFSPGSDAMIQDMKSYKSVSIPQGVTITAGGTNPLIIKSQGAVQVDGTLTASALPGGNGVTFSTFGKGAVGAAGGSNGGDGVFVGGPSNGNDGQGAGAGLKGTNWQGASGAGFGQQGGSSPKTNYGAGITGGPAYGTADLMTFQGGSGGGGGSGGSNCGSGGGGAGGGAIEIVSAVSITINGTVSTDGGNGGSDGGGNCGGGGGGSGGAIWLRAPTITNNGTISAVGGLAGKSTITTGGAGSVGRIRLDSNGMTMGTINPMPGFTGNLPYNSSGTTISTAIAPMGLCAWGKVTFSIDTTAMGTSVTVDVIDANNMVLAPNVMNGTDLSTIPAIAGAKSIKLRATLATQSSAGSPKLTSWKVEYFTQ
jgi:hypothetical protein